MQKVHSVIQSVLQKRRDRDAQVQNAGNATVEVATRDDSKIDDSRQVSSWKWCIMLYKAYLSAVPRWRREMIQR